MTEITKKDIEEFAEACTDEEVLIFDNYLPAFIGITIKSRAVYDYSKMIEYLLDEGLTLNEAKDRLENDTIKSIGYMGDRAPIIIFSYSKE